jgi:hypothetical protein
LKTTKQKVSKDVSKDLSLPVIVEHDYESNGWPNLLAAAIEASLTIFLVTSFTIFCFFRSTSGSSMVDSSSMTSLPFPFHFGSDSAVPIVGVEGAAFLTFEVDAEAEAEAEVGEVAEAGEGFFALKVDADVDVEVEVEAEVARVAEAVEDFFAFDVGVAVELEVEVEGGDADVLATGVISWVALRTVAASLATKVVNWVAVRVVAALLATGVVNWVALRMLAALLATGVVNWVAVPTLVACHWIVAGAAWARGRMTVGDAKDSIVMSDAGKE